MIQNSLNHNCNHQPAVWRIHYNLNSLRFMTWNCMHMNVKWDDVDGAQIKSLFSHIAGLALVDGGVISHPILHIKMDSPVQSNTCNNNAEFTSICIYIEVIPLFPIVILDVRRWRCELNLFSKLAPPKLAKTEGNERKKSNVGYICFVWKTLRLLAHTLFPILLLCISLCFFSLFGAANTT